MKLTRRRMITIGVAAAVLAISVTSLASGVSLRQLVKKEVTKQIAKATGPAGATGATGAAGAPGAAKAFGSITYTNDTPTIDAGRIRGDSERHGNDDWRGNGRRRFRLHRRRGSVQDRGRHARTHGTHMVSVWIPDSPGPPFTVGTCPAASDLLVLVNTPGGTFGYGSFTIALF